jgi:hypothetical protein
MDFFFPDQNPDIERLPPDRVQILNLKAEPYRDGRRVRVNLEVTPFQKRPYLEVTLNDPQGQEVSTVSIVEPISWRLEFTMHLQRERMAGEYSLLARLFYPKPLEPEDPEPGTPTESSELNSGEEVPDTDQRRLTFEMS